MKVVADVDIDQPNKKKKKYVYLNEKVKILVSKYDTYTDKLKYLKAIAVLQNAHS